MVNITLETRKIPIIPVQDNQKERAFKFSKDSVQKGQSGTNFNSNAVRDYWNIISNTLQGKIAEIVLGDMLGVPIDMETGKRLHGSQSATSDVGYDFEYNNKKISCNAIDPSCNLLAIATSKYERHVKEGVTHLLLVRSMRKPTSWTERSVKKALKQLKNIYILGIVDIDRFGTESYIINPNTYPFYFQVENKAMHNTALEYWTDITQEILNSCKGFCREQLFALDG